MAVVISCFRFVFAAVTSDQALSHLDRISQLTLQIGLSHDQKSQPEHIKWPGNNKKHIILGDVAQGRDFRQQQTSPP